MRITTQGTELKKEILITYPVHCIDSKVAWC